MRKAPCLLCRHNILGRVGTYGFCNKRMIYKWTPYHNCNDFDPPSYPNWRIEILLWYKQQAKIKQIRVDSLIRYYQEQGIDTNQKVFELGE